MDSYCMLLFSGTLIGSSDLPGWLAAIPVTEAKARGEIDAADTGVATCSRPCGDIGPWDRQGNDHGSGFTRLDHTGLVDLSFNRLHEILGPTLAVRRKDDDWPPLRYGLYSLEVYYVRLCGKRDGPPLKRPSFCMAGPKLYVNRDGAPQKRVP